MADHNREYGLGRLPEFDERSRNYPVRQLLGQKVPRSYTWRCDTHLDQRSTPHCVGYSMAHELAARPAELKVTAEAADWYYRVAQTLDQWPGNDYDGSSVLGGLKALKVLGLIGGYRWSFTFTDVLLGIGYGGPALAGTTWTEGMFHPDRNGYIRPTGDPAGGHAYMITSVDIRQRRALIWNSWGRDWGRDGTAWITFDDLEALLADRGECAFVTTRTRPARATRSDPRAGVSSE